MPSESLALEVIVTGSLSETLSSAISAITGDTLGVLELTSLELLLSELPQEYRNNKLEMFKDSLLIFMLRFPFLLN